MREGGERRVKLKGEEGKQSAKRVKREGEGKAEKRGGMMRNNVPREKERSR